MSTFLQLLKALAEETGDHLSSTTTSLGTTSTLICASFDNSNVSASGLENAAVLIEDGNNAGEQRVVRRNGLDNATGTLTMAETYTNAVASGVAFSAYSRMPALTRLAGPSYQKALNQTIRRAWVEDTINFTGVDQQKHYPIDMAAYSWLTEPSRIISVYHPRQNADDELVALGSNEWDWNWDGSVRQLVLPTAPWKTGDTGLVKVYRPANSILRLDATARATVAAGAVTAITVVTGGYYTVAPTVTISGGGGSGATATATLTNGTVTSIAVGAGGTLYTTAPTVTLTAGGWADQTSQTAGLSALSDECLLDVNDAVVLGKYHVYTMLHNLHAPGQTTSQWQVAASRAAAVASRLKCLSPRPNRLTGIPSLRPAYSGSRGYQ